MHKIQKYPTLYNCSIHLFISIRKSDSISYRPHSDHLYKEYVDINFILRLIHHFPSVCSSNYRSLRISTPLSDSACSSSAESSDCESTTHPQHIDAPVEIVPGLFLGNSSHSEDSKALQKYNIQYVLNVTPDLPNVFESTGTIKYLQIPITDHGSQDLAIHFPAAIKFIGK